MTKAQGYNALWSRFGLPAYNENSVPDEAEMPYITYQVITDGLDNPVTPTASVWYKSTSWREIHAKVEEIAEELSVISAIPIDEGFMYINTGTPFSQDMADDTDRTVKRVLLNVGIEFLTNY